MTSIEELLARLARLLEDGGIPYMIIGGQAVLIHGEPRLTVDVDVTLGVGIEQFPRVLALLGQGALTPIPDDPESFARQTCVLPARDSDSMQRIDFVFSDTAYERQAIAHGVRRSISGAQVCFASPEDLLIQKLVAGRSRDIEDARGVWLRNKGRLDGAYIELWLKQFAEIPGLEAVAGLWDQIRRERSA